MLYDFFCTTPLADLCPAVANESGTIEISTLIAMDSGYLCTPTSLNQVSTHTPPTHLSSV